MRLLIFLTILVFGLTAFSAEQPPRVVRMGGAPMPPLVFVDESGKVDGVIPQVVHEIAKKHNWQVEWQIDSWSNQLERLKTGELDVMSAIGYSDERARFFDFSEQSVLSVWGQLYTHEGYTIDNFLQLDGQEVAVLRNGISGIRFAELCSRFGVECILRPMDSYQQVFEALDNKQVTAGVVNSHYGFVVEHHYKVIRSDVMFNPFPVLFASPKDTHADLLSAIDDALKEWKADKESVYYQITDNWILANNQTSFPTWLIYSLYVLTGSILLISLVAFLLRQEVKRRTRELSLSEAQLKQIINLVPHAIFATDATGKIILANLESTRVFNQTLSELKSLTRAELMQKQPHLEALLAEDDKFMGRQTGSFNQEVEVIHQFEGPSYYQMAKVPFVRKKSHIPAVVTVAVDITEQKLSTERIEHLAKHDELTDLPNRTLLMDRINQSIALAKRHNRVGAIIFVDMDLFKNVNDTLGHSVGDVLLQVTAARLKKHCREADTVARFGGDEFIVLLNELGSDFENAQRNAINIARKIRMDVVKEAYIGRHEISVSISQGIAFFPYDADKPEQLIKRADLAMYHSKLLGRNKVVTFHPSMEQKINRKEKLKNELKQAVRREELSLVYQPQFDTRTGRFRGAEALIRWKHRHEDYISPLEFIPIAEETGIVLEVGEYVLTEACMQAARWNEQLAEPFYITVNLSARQIASKSLVPFIERVLKLSGLAPELLELEVTESLLMVDMDRAVQILNQLKEQGIKVSLDDFGTGYSSLSYLKKLPLDKLKIDKSFVNDIPGDRDSETIAKTIISMANQLDMEVVAEGVETEEQVEFFSEQGCHLFQGFYYSTPCSAPEMTRKFIKLISKTS